MTELRRIFVGTRSSALVRIYRVLDGNAGPPSFYFSCKRCGNCSKHHADEQKVCEQAFDHLEEHEAGTT